MLEAFIPSLSNELMKIAADLGARKANRFHKSDEKDWDQFEKDLKSKGFQKAIVQHPNSDRKLKKYTKAFGGYLTSKDTVSGVPSRTQLKKNYRIKTLADGRLACGCKDWQYKHSHKGTDCWHLKEFKRSGLAKGLEKKSGIAPGMKALIKGVKFTNDLEQNEERWQKGKLVKHQLKAKRAAAPFGQL